MIGLILLTILLSLSPTLHAMNLLEFICSNYTTAAQSMPGQTVINVTKGLYALGLLAVSFFGLRALVYEGKQWYNNYKGDDIPITTRARVGALEKTNKEQTTIYANNNNLLWDHIRNLEQAIEKKNKMQTTMYARNNMLLWAHIGNLEHVLFLKNNGIVDRLHLRIIEQQRKTQEEIQNLSLRLAQLEKKQLSKVYIEMLVNKKLALYDPVKYNNLAAKEFEIDGINNQLILLDQDIMTLRQGQRKILQQLSALEESE